MRQGARVRAREPGLETRKKEGILLRPLPHRSSRPQRFALSVGYLDERVLQQLQGGGARGRVLLFRFVSDFRRGFEELPGGKICVRAGLRDSAVVTFCKQTRIKSLNSSLHSCCPGRIDCVMFFSLQRASEAKARARAGARGRFTSLLGSVGGSLLGIRKIALIGCTLLCGGSPCDRGQGG